MNDTSLQGRAMAGERAGNSAGFIPSEAEIKALVHGFYAKVRNDDALGPIFNRVISDWDPHLEKMCDFWSSVMRMSGAYRGNPMAAHLRLKMVRPEHFQRWLALFAETARELFEPEHAQAFIGRAENIGHSLQLGMFYRPAAPRAPA
jgi:hemoglobin